MWKSSHLLEEHGLKGRMRTITFINISVSTFVSIHVNTPARLQSEMFRKNLADIGEELLLPANFFLFSFQSHAAFMLRNLTNDSSADYLRFTPISS